MSGIVEKKIDEQKMKDPDYQRRRQRAPSYYDYDGFYFNKKKNDPLNLYIAGIKEKGMSYAEAQCRETCMLNGMRYNMEV